MTQEMNGAEAAAFVDDARRKVMLEDYQAVKPWGGLPADLAKQLVEGDQRFDNKGKLNIYTCKDCRGHIVTRDIDVGVTPFSTSCHATEGCKGMMTSSMYRVFEQRMRASHVWYRPHPAMAFTGSTRDHLQQGGLIMRPATGEEG